MPKKRKYNGGLGVGIQGRKRRDVVSFEDAEPISRGSEGVVSDLCQRCAKIDLDEVFRRRHETKNGYPVADFGPIPDWDTTDSCSLCKLIRSIMPENSAGLDNVSLWSYDSRRNLQIGAGVVDAVMLGVPGCSEYLMQNTDETVFVRRLQPKSIDYKIIRNWIAYCKTNHIQACAVRTGVSVPYLKLIDCRTRCIVPAADHVYVTLSYVWGATANEEGYMQTLPANLPGTIEDSVTVTLALGYRYLWIDRYCIDQSRTDEVQQQVEKMDLVYKNSEITIIATAGADPSYGLPGVSERARTVHTFGKVGKRALISTLDFRMNAISRSRWNTRAWTYQEALLSRRRLVFTDQQVYFECYGMYCCEAFKMPLDRLHTKDKQRFLQQYCLDKNVGLFPRGVGSSPWNVLDRIEEYTRRQLSHDSDILKGLLGVLRMFNESFDVYHLFGTPILLPVHSSMMSNTNWTWIDGKSYPDHLGVFRESLAGLFWQPQRPTTRRVGFPSWSWTGWHGPVTWDCKRLETKAALAQPIVEIMVNYGDGRNFPETWWSLSNIKRNPDLQSRTPEQTIRLTALSTKIELLRAEDTNGIRTFVAKLQISGGPTDHIEWKFAPTCSELPANLHCYGLHLAGHMFRKPTPTTYRQPTDPSRGPGLLILTPMSSQGDLWERVGFAWADLPNHREPTAREIHYGTWRSPENLIKNTPLLIWERRAFMMR